MKFPASQRGPILTYRKVRRGVLFRCIQRLSVVVLAVSCFAVVQILGGSGFIAAFTGGLLFVVLAKDHKPKLLLAPEGWVP